VKRFFLYFYNIRRFGHIIETHNTFRIKEFIIFRRAMVIFIWKKREIGQIFDILFLVLDSLFDGFVPILTFK